MNIEKQIEYNIKNIDLNLIYNVVKVLGIKTSHSKNKELSKKELGDIAEFCMRKAYTSESGYFSTGGFEAEVINGIIELRFVLSKISPLEEILK